MPLARSFRALALAALLPLGSSAQEAAPPLPQDPRAPRFHDVERGFFTGFEVGYLTLFSTPTANPAKFPFAGKGGGTSSGFVVATLVGYDVNPRLAVAVFALGANSRASLSYGSFSLFAGGGDVRFALHGSRDANDVERLFVYAHGRAGWLVTYPDGLFGTHDLYLAGGPGLEYYTRLRHFSVGLAADLAYLPTAKTAGVVVTPTIRYTF